MTRYPLAGPAVAAAAVLWGAALPRVGFGGAHGRTWVSAGVGLCAVVAARASGMNRTELGLEPSRVPAGLRWGGAAAAATLAGYAVALAVPGAHTRFADATGGNRDDFHAWVWVHIPIGTVLAEELLFRGVLTPLVSPVVHAAAFGLWHVRPARTAGDSVLGTVAVTALAALGFDRLRRASGSVVAPMLAHLAVNVGGAVAVRIATSRGRGADGRASRGRVPEHR
ncbi:CPBP family intramembrane glutamic endopeptidase [Rhodococcus chondri]|uniref:CPBP family intramembrane metalloprotease n=1 Tax=Rhodococcus chondri TaxID=3065941 RepID=A0ABU7JR51_9NOCA|nr:CPBP family intramembrane glutamic endopeptidase [Rhodococcus sp. CC-R104]MEE2032511.1 CPBP family intramembrane metalloprotease [Rhodococcus sp. CC-R104]